MTSLKKDKRSTGSKNTSQSDIKQYKVTKIVFATSFHDAILKEPSSEIVDFCLNQDLQIDSNKIGYAN